MKCQFAEVFVERDQDPAIGYRSGKDIFVSAARRVGPDPYNIMPLCAQGDDCFTGNVFIGEKFHDATCRGKTFSAWSVSPAYFRHARMSSCVSPG